MLRILVKFLKRYWIFIVTFSVIATVSMGFIYELHKPPPSLPIYNPDMLDASLVDSSMQKVRKYHTIPDFKLINQNGDTITQAAYKGKIYVADFFYTTCPSFCPILTANMKKVQDKYKDDDEIKLLSHSVTPKIDSVAQLKKYAEKKGVDDDKWNLVTGPKKEIYDLARKSYFVAKDGGGNGPGAGGKYDMIHTENLALIDEEKRIRGFYDGTDDDEVQDLLDDIKTLKKIEHNREEEN